MDSTHINTFGLLLDIIGAILIWKYGLPERISRTGASYLMLEENDAEQIALAKEYDFWAGVGIALLVGGFALQIISNYL